MNKTTICLSMIIRNESRVIRRCLLSVIPFIDYWVIIDTGSTDRTQEIVRETLKDIPGELYERPWVHFAHNRTEALQLAKQKGDYALLIDADEEIIANDAFFMPELTAQVYLVNIEYLRTRFHRELLVDNRLDWYWKGVLHEQIYCRAPLREVQVLENIMNQSRPEGNRSLDPCKFQKDAELLEKVLIEEPNNTRYAFYLAQSYACGGLWSRALACYKRRAEMGGWDQEVYYSLYSVGHMQERLDYDRGTIIDTYARAYAFRPIRAEALFRMAWHYCYNRQYELAKMVCEWGLEVEYPQDSMFVEPAIYRYGLRLMAGDCCKNLLEVDEALFHYEMLLSRELLPQDLQYTVKEHVKDLKQKRKFSA